MIKIISKEQYDELIKLLKEAYVIVTSLEAENKKLKRDLSDLQNFCIRFANDNTKFGNAYNLDFPSSTCSEDKTY